MAITKIRGHQIAAATIEVDHLLIGKDLAFNGYAITNLKTGVQNGDAANTGQVNTVATNLASEATARAAADTTLTNNLAAEVTRAQAAEAALTTAVSDEAAARTSADTTLTNNLAAEVTRAQAAEAALTTAVSDEATARAAADTTLQTNITNEATARTSADTTLTNNLAAEVSRAQAAESALTTAVSDEATARAAADTTLTNNLSAEVTRATTAEAAIQAEVDAEEIRAQAAEAALTTAVSDEATARAAADTTLTNAISAEVTRAQGAETTLATNLASEVTRAQAAEADLQLQVTGLANGIFPKAAVEARTTGNLDATYAAGANGSYPGVDATLTANANGAFTASLADGVDLAAMIAAPFYPRLLVMNQTDPTLNGIYNLIDAGSESTPWVLKRSADCDGAPQGEIVANIYTYTLAGGTTYSNKGYILDCVNPVVVGSTELNWVLYQNLLKPDVVAGAGLKSSEAAGVITIDVDLAKTGETEVSGLVVDVNGQLKVGVDGSTIQIVNNQLTVNSSAAVGVTNEGDGISIVDGKISVDRTSQRFVATEAFNGDTTKWVVETSAPFVSLTNEGWFDIYLNGQALDLDTENYDLAAGVTGTQITVKRAIAINDKLLVKFFVKNIA